MTYVVLKGYLYNPIDCVKPAVASFGFSNDILATNLINLSVVLGVLIFFGKGVCASCLFQE